MDRPAHNAHVRTIVAFALALTLVTSPAAAQPTTVSQTVTVQVLKPGPSIPTGGMFRADVAVTVTAPTEYLEVRLRLLGPSGNLVYQKTYVRSELPAGRHVISYERDLTGRGLSPGRYPIEIRVLATASEAIHVQDRILLVGADAAAVPVALVAAINDVPGTAPDGRFWRDPAQATGVRDAVASLVGLAHNRGVTVGLAIPPVLLEDLARAAGGYETTAGVQVAADSDVPRAYLQVLDELRAAVAAGSIELLDVPYALPDMASMKAIGASDDLALHWARTDATVATVLQSSTTTSTAYLGNRPAPAALASLPGRADTAVIVGGSALTMPEGTLPGHYRIASLPTSVIVADEAAAAGAASGESAFFDAMYAHLGTSASTVLLFELGPGSESSVADIGRAAAWIDDVAWLRQVPLSELPDAVLLEASFGEQVSTPAPEGYWESVRASRQAIHAFARAVGEADPQLQTVRRDVLVAESSLWAGSNAAWTNLATAQAYAQSPSSFVADQFSRIRIDAKDVMLSSKRGDVPFTVVNGTGKPLTLTVTASSRGVVTERESYTITVQPADNFLTIPVDLDKAIDDDLTIALSSANVPIAQAVVHVSSSYLDRLAIVGMVVIVLVSLLVFIRRRVQAPIAATIGDGTNHDAEGL